MADADTNKQITPEEIAAARLEFGRQLAPCAHCAGQVLNPRHYGMDFIGPALLSAQPPEEGLTIWWWQVRCFNGSCGAAVLNAQTPADAVERWNRRPAK